ncbi:MAG: hypothetical protein ABIQ39_12030 [Ilumatobacteraceae bacterium]
MSVRIDGCGSAMVVTTVVGVVGVVGVLLVVVGAAVEDVEVATTNTGIGASVGVVGSCGRTTR